MPYVTSIERLAKKEGYEEGFAIGARSELLAMIRADLKRRFGSAPSPVMAKVRSIKELPRLRKLAWALLDIESLQAFRDLLEITRAKNKA